MLQETFTMDPDWREFHPHPSVPGFTVPGGAVDAHCHVFGPGHLFPYAPNRKYTPCDAPKEKLWALRARLGFARSVIVQAACHGADNRAMVDALRHSNDSARGVAVVTPGTGEDELRELDTAGVRAVRFNFLRRLVDALPRNDLQRVAEKVASLGWHIVIYFEAEDLPDLYDFFTSLPAAVVVDHLGRLDVSRDPEGEEFQLFLRLLRENGNFWAKVSCPERLSASGPPAYDDVVPFARRVVEAFPERVLWGTDWPHPNMKSHMPDDGKLVDFIPRIAVTPDLQKKLLVDNPLRLYWGQGQK